MRLWNKLFGKKAGTPARPSVTSNPQPPSIRPIPAAPPQTLARRQSVVIPEQSAVVPSAEERKLEKLRTNLKDNPDFALTEKDTLGRTPLHDATVNGHKDIAALLLANGAEVDGTDDKGDTPLHLAARSGKKDIVELLLANGAEVNAKNRDGSTPLFKAVLNSKNDIAELLRQHGASDLSAEILDAARKCDSEKVERLLKDHPELVFRKDEYGNTALHYAARPIRNEYGTPDFPYAAHLQLMKLLLANKAEVNAKNDSGATPLHYAVWYDTDFARMMLAEGADINARDNDGATPLHYAAAQRDGGDDPVAMLELLLAHGAQVNAKTKDGNTPFRSAVYGGRKNAEELLRKHGGYVSCGIHGAAERGELEEVKAQIEKNPGLVFSRDEYGKTPLHYAATSYFSRYYLTLSRPLAFMGVVKFLLANNSEVDAEDKHRNTPLHYAARTAGRDMVELLLANGAKVNASNDDGDTPMYHAARFGKTDVVELLLTNGAGVNVKNDKGDTPLHMAAFGGKTDVVELLLANGAEVRAENNKGETPVHHAAYQDHEDVMKLLRQHSGQQLPSIHELAQHGASTIITTLLKGSPDLVFSKDRTNRTPLHWAADNCHKHVVQLLLANKAEVNAKDDSGASPLHLTANYQKWREKREEVVESLLAHGAEVDAKDDKGRTPLHLAARSDNWMVAKILLAKKAEINAKDDNGWTPVRHAAYKGHGHAAMMLRNHGGHE